MSTSSDHDRAAAAADYYRLDDLLSDDERALRDRVRAFGENEVLPVINDHWERAGRVREPGIEVWLEPQLPRDRSLWIKQ